MSLSDDATSVQDRIADCVKDLTRICHRSSLSVTQLDKPIQSLNAAYFDLDKSIGALLRDERKNG